MIFRGMISTIYWYYLPAVDEGKTGDFELLFFGSLWLEETVDRIFLGARPCLCSYGAFSVSTSCDVVRGSDSLSIGGVMSS